jgi:uncharacterized tellurite resistance protein B-like protein
MEDKFKHKLLQTESKMGTDFRNDTLNKFINTEKKNKKMLIKEMKGIVNYDYMMNDINKCNNQDFLPFIHELLFNQNESFGVSYLKITIDFLKSLNEEKRDKLVSLCKTISVLLLLDKTSNEIKEDIIKNKKKFI